MSMCPWINYIACMHFYALARTYNFIMAMLGRAMNMDLPMSYQCWKIGHSQIAMSKNCEAKASPTPCMCFKCTFDGFFIHLGMAYAQPLTWYSPLAPCATIILLEPLRPHMLLVCSNIFVSPLNWAKTSTAFWRKASSNALLHWYRPHYLHPLRPHACHRNWLPLSWLLFVPCA